MKTLYFIISGMLIILSVLPFNKNQYWFFRVPEFIKLQILVGQIILLISALWVYNDSAWFWVITLIQSILTIYHIYILFRYTKFYKKHALVKNSGETLPTLKIISANVYQFNTNYEKFQTLIKEIKPDIFITIESNSQWEKANRRLEPDYPYTHKVSLENTYGMHMYSKLEFKKVATHFFVEDDIPSIEAHFNSNGKDFVIFAVHPPPPSPTEETTSKERDGDLMSIAKRMTEIKKPRMVIGDFNTVSWSNTSRLFKKVSGLIDARIGRGILASFHAKYWFIRIPLDLLFHSADIYVKDLKTLRNIGSDHFPVYCEFSVGTAESHEQKEKTEKANNEEKAEAEKLIQEGREETSDNR